MLFRSEGLKLQYLGLLMLRADSLEKTLMLGKTEGQRRRGQQRRRWLDSITDSTDMNLSKLCKIVKNKGAWSAAVPWWCRVGHNLVTKQHEGRYSLRLIEPFS